MKTVSLLSFNYFIIILFTGHVKDLVSYPSYLLLIIVTIIENTKSIKITKDIYNQVNVFTVF